MDKNYFQENLTVDDIFEAVKADKYAVYDFDTEECLDNIWAMRDFTDSYIPEENMDLDDGTQCFIVHEDYDFMIVLDCGGRGDLNCHRVEATWFKQLSPELNVKQKRLNEIKELELRAEELKKLL